MNKHAVRKHNKPHSALLHGMLRCVSAPLKRQIFPSGAGGEQNRAKRKVNTGLTFIGWPKA